MLAQSLPLPTPYDPAEDPPGSIDPLGTVATSEQLADVLLPGVTGRMWRARHLTFAALAAFVGEQAAAAADGSEEMRLEARLALERFFVSAIARKDIKEDGWQNAAKRLPGISLARRAVLAGNQPLGKQNFLKGQAINGPFGVVQRLTRNLDIIDDDNRLSRNGEVLLLAWSAEQDLAGLDEPNSQRPGAKWLKKLLRPVIDHVRHGTWPRPGWWGWTELAERLRPDGFGSRERAALFQLLASESSPTRSRCIKLLLSPDLQRSFRTAIASGSRGVLDREILAQQMRNCVQGGEDDVDRLIYYAVQLIESYEHVSGHADSAFRGLMWALTRRGGRSTVDDLLGDSALAGHLASARHSLRRETQRFQTLISELKLHPRVLDAVREDRLDQLAQDAREGVVSERGLVDAVMSRHRRVQTQKRKGVWIESDDFHWTLMPGFGDSSDAPWRYDGVYLHPYRVSNAYSLLNDLGKVRRVEVPDGEDY